ncbi:response regulator transcription factor [Paenibacillus roseipurpureus]|uniref:Response regulator n=1 Tax=Paenibacillus roseopurpureus TaxID=2918901 RepID=A0AA96RIJ3_9BACL|nr:response regulator [Paenibacillus sp. MBLB1832]WNR42875.1 response regulator [Paenibacillus sp. MBLB1832]
MSEFTVMLVEDEERIRRGLKSLLEDVFTGYKVIHEAGNGKEAIDMLTTRVPDFIVADIRMPVMNGFEFSEKVRMIHAQMPIIFLSGYAEFDYVRKALRTGVTDYLLKPVDRVELKKTLERLVPTLLLHRQSQQVNVENEQEEGHQIIRKVKDMLSQRFHEDITLQTAADEVGLSYQYMSQLFKSKTGMSYSDYVLTLRMNKAKQLLRETRMRIYEISELCGYANPKYFMNAFKQSEGITPKEYRNHM